MPVKSMDFEPADTRSKPHRALDEAIRRSRIGNFNDAGMKADDLASLSKSPSFKKRSTLGND